MRLGKVKRQQRLKKKITKMCPHAALAVYAGRSLAKAATIIGKARSTAQCG